MSRQSANPTDSSPDLLVQELEIARRSRPSTQAIDTYHSFFEHVERKSPLISSALSEIIQGLRGQLMMDSRQQTALQGIRNAAATSYRLLYSTDRADIELLVEPDVRMRRIEGEVLALDADDPITPALVQLLRQGDDETIHETTCNEDERFHFADVLPGHYQLTIMPAIGASLEITQLEIT